MEGQYSQLSLKERSEIQEGLYEPSGSVVFDLLFWRAIGTRSGPRRSNVGVASNAALGPDFFPDPPRREGCAGSRSPKNCVCRVKWESEIPKDGVSAKKLRL